MINRPITPTPTQAIFWLFTSGLMAWGLGNPLPAIAHGVELTYQTLEAVEIQAMYDNGDPMSNAQITIYAPTDPETPWQQGTTDEEGRFLFAPDTSLAGNWAVRVRQAGHGGILNVAIAPETAPADPEPSPDTTGIPQQTASSPPSRYGPSSAVNPLPTALAIASGVWGFVGTALFFSRFNSNAGGRNRNEEDPVS
jgi:nickel transport protein